MEMTGGLIKHLYRENHPQRDFLRSSKEAYDRELTWRFSVDLFLLLSDEYWGRYVVLSEKLRRTLQDSWYVPAGPQVRS